MSSSDNINLFEKSGAVPEYVKLLELQIKKFANFLVIITVITASIAFFAFSTLNLRLESLKRTKTRLESRLEDLRSVESKFLVIKSRIGMISKIVESSKPVGDMITLANEIYPPPFLTGINYTEQGQIQLSFKANSIEETMDMSNRMLAKLESETINKVTLASYSIGENGIILQFNFYPIW